MTERLQDVDEPNPSRFSYIGRGMVAGALGGGTAAVVALACWNLLTIFSPLSPANFTAFRDAVAASADAVLFLCTLTGPIWLSVGLAAGAAFGSVVGSRKVDRRVLVSTAVLGSVLVGALPAMLRMPASALVSAVVGGWLGGSVTVIAYGWLTARLPHPTVEEREDAEVASSSWPVYSLLRLLVAVVVSMYLALLERDLATLWLVMILPLLIAIGWALNVADGIRSSATRPPWMSPRRLALALIGGFVAVTLLTSLSAAYPVEITRHQAQDSGASHDSTPLDGHGWPFWWALNVDQSADDDGEYRPWANLQNAALWTALVALSLLIEPAVGSVVRRRVD